MLYNYSGGGEIYAEPRIETNGHFSQPERNCTETLDRIGRCPDQDYYGKIIRNGGKKVYKEEAAALFIWTETYFKNRNKFGSKIDLGPYIRLFIDSLFENKEFVLAVWEEYCFVADNLSENQP